MWSSPGRPNGCSRAMTVRMYVLDPARTTVEMVASWGRQAPSQHSFTPGDCWALRRGRLHVVDGGDAELICPHVELPRLGRPAVRTARRSGRYPGPSACPRPPSSAGHDTRDTAGRTRAPGQDAGRHVGLTLANIQLRETLREQSWRDSLTGLFNRRYMEETLRREIRRAEREGYQVGLLMADLDNFKQLNDAFGHAAGDEELRRVGRLLTSAVRAEDVACRFGGEEFVVILPKASVEDDAPPGRGAAGGGQARPGGGSTRLYPTTTMSVGVAGYPEHGTTAEELIMAADSAMYRGEGRGRDRVAIASRHDGQPSRSPPASHGRPFHRRRRWAACRRTSMPAPAGFRLMVSMPELPEVETVAQRPPAPPAARWRWARPGDHRRARRVGPDAAGRGSGRFARASRPPDRAHRPARQAAGDRPRRGRFLTIHLKMTGQLFVVPGHRADRSPMSGWPSRSTTDARFGSATSASSDGWACTGPMMTRSTASDPNPWIRGSRCETSGP